MGLAGILFMSLGKLRPEAAQLGNVMLIGNSLKSLRPELMSTRDAMLPLTVATMSVRQLTSNRI